MQLNPKLPLHDRFQARLAAQAIVRNLFDPRRTVAELRPDLRTYSHFFAKLLDTPEVQHEVEKIMNRTERNAARFLDKMWDWLEADSVGDKDVAENKRTAARILAKGYISEKASKDAPTQPMRIEGLDGDALDKLTAAPVQREKVQ